MASLVYSDNVLGLIPPPNPSPLPVSYLNSTIQTQFPYPSSNFITTLGPVYLPSIYASNLSALEVGSSGSIQYTLFDIHSLDVTRSSDSNILFNVCNQNDSLSFALSNSNATAYIKLDGSNGANSIIMSAACNIAFNADTLTQNIRNTLAFNTGCNFIVTASNDILETANSNMSLIASAGSFNISATSGKNVFSMDKLTGSATWSSSNNIFINSSNNTQFYSLQTMSLQSAYDDVLITAAKKIQMTAQTDSFSISATNGTNTFLMDKVSGNTTWATTANTYVNTSNDFIQTIGRDETVTAARAMSLTASSNAFTISAYARSNLIVLDNTGVNVNTLSNITMGASNQVNLTANSNMNLTATNNNIVMKAGQQIQLQAQTDSFSVSATAGTNTFLMDKVSGNTTWATTANTYINSSNDFVQTTGRDVVVTAARAMALTAASSSFTLSAFSGSNLTVMNNDGIQVNTLSNITMGASNVVALTANSNMTLTATNNNVSVTAGKQIQLVAQDDSFSVSATNGTNTLLMDKVSGNATWATTANTYVNTSNDYVQTTGRDIQVTAARSMSLTTSSSSFSLSAFAGSNLTIMDSDGVKLNTLSNITMGASNVVALTANSNMTLTATNNDVNISAGKKIVMVAQNDSFSVTATNGTNSFLMDQVSKTTTLSSLSNINIKSATGIYQSASNVYQMQTVDAVSVGTSTIQVQNALVSPTQYLQLNTTTQSTTLRNSQGGIYISTEFNLNENATSKTSTINGNLSETISGAHSMAVAQGQYVGVTNTATYTTAQTMNISASNTLNLSTVNQDINVTSTGRAINIKAPTFTGTGVNEQGAININAAANGAFINHNVGAGGLHQFMVNGSPIMSVNSTDVIIKANLQVQGVIDSINVSQTTLLVQDKQIYLAYGSNDGSNITDGITNDGAGIVIPGCGMSNLANGNTISVPQTSTTNIGVYEKSFKWNYGNMTGLGIFTKSVETESYWEVKGGSLRITNMNPTAWDGQANVTASNPISFTLRINNTGELEIVKLYKSGANYVNSIVAKFGRTLR